MIGLWFIIPIYKQMTVATIMTTVMNIIFMTMMMMMKVEIVIKMVEEVEEEIIDDEEGIEKVVQSISHKLGCAQLNWSTIEKEGYAVIYALQKLQHYLYGAKF